MDLIDSGTYPATLIDYRWCFYPRDNHQQEINLGGAAIASEEENSGE